MKIISMLIIATLLIAGCRIKTTKMATNDKEISVNPTESIAPDQTTEFVCKLTTPELQRRKSTVIESLRKQVLQTKELKNGYGFKFNATDQMIDELTEFIKTEKACCSFFTFTLVVSGDEAWLELTGAEGTKDFMKAELEL